jgi:hypothetical protein
LARKVATQADMRSAAARPQPPDRSPVKPVQSCQLTLNRSLDSVPRRLRVNSVGGAHRWHSFAGRCSVSCGPQIPITELSPSAGGLRTHNEIRGLLGNRAQTCQGAARGSSCHSVWLKAGASASEHAWRGRRTPAPTQRVSASAGGSAW